MGAASYGLWLTEKGKILDDSHILKIAAESFLIVFDARKNSAAALALVGRNLIADEVEAVDASPDWTEIVLWRPGAGEICRSLLGAVPGKDRFVETDGVLAFPGRFSAGENFRLLIPAPRADEWEDRLRVAGAVAGDREELRRERIAAGIPVVPEDVGPGDLPNEGGLETVAISYTKGCYLGQEVTNRLKTMGQIRRRLHLVHGPGLPPPVHAWLHQNNRKLGEIRSVSRDGEGYVALAMLTLAPLDSASPLSLTPEGPAEIRIVRPV